MKKIIAFAYILTIVVMATATIVENTEGTAFVAKNIYGAWWFVALWAVLAATGTVYFVRRRVKRASVWCLHASFVVILAGALLTHLTAYQGLVAINRYSPTDEVMMKDGRLTDIRLPFTLQLDSINVSYHKGTSAAEDYIATFTISDDGTASHGIVSMNNIYSHGGVRLYMSGYNDDADRPLVYLAVNSDPWGIPVTYLGYALLFVSLVWMLFDPKGRYRSLLRLSAENKAAKTPKTRLMAFFLMLITASANATATTNTTVTVLPQDKAEAMCQLIISYNERISPMQTFALDFTKKVSGGRSWNGYSAEQVFTGFILFADEWNREPIFRIKSSAVREQTGLAERVSFNTLVSSSNTRLRTLIDHAYHGGSDAIDKDVRKVDDAIMSVMFLEKGYTLKMFPYHGHWYAPTDSVETVIEADRQTYFRSALPMLAAYAKASDWQHFDEMLLKMRQYQYKYGGEAIPSPLRLKAERMYNAVPYATILFMVCLTMGFVSIVRNRRVRILGIAVLALSFAVLTLTLALRWIVSGTIPMSNGYETMLLMAWIIQLASLLTLRRFDILLTFGLLLSGFFLLVSHISQMDPKITHVMPVLQSPLLTVHVSVIMMSYALLALTAICSLWGLIVRRKSDEMYLLSQLLLYPAMTTLGIGIFVGAIWANVSWGTYWSWDPKETWALITMLIYAVPLHQASVPLLRRHRAYHVYMVVAFLSVLFTYFGVNYLLSGMHSYA